MPNINVPSQNVGLNPPLHAKVKKLVAEYGWLAIVILILGSYLVFVWNVTGILVQRADNQANSNEKIGILEGKMEILLQEKNNQQTCIIPTPTPTPK